MIKEVLLSSASFLLRYCCLLVFFPLSSILNGQTKSDLYHLGEHNMEMTYWTQADGLPSWIITNVVGDKRGFIWMATDKGLCRFDGKKFVHFPLSHFKVSAVHNIIGGDRNGKLWLIVSREGEEQKPIIFDPVSGSYSSVAAYTGVMAPEGPIQNSYNIADTIFLHMASGELWRYDNILRVVLSGPPSRNVYLPAGNGLFWHLSDVTHKNFELTDSGRTFLKTLPVFRNHLSDFWLDKKGRLCIYDPLLPGYGGLLQPYQLSREGDILPVESNLPRIFKITISECRYVAADQFGYGYALTPENKLQVFCKNQIVTNDLIPLLRERYNILPGEYSLFTPDRSGGVWIKCNGGVLRIRFRPSIVKTYPALKNFSFRGIHALNDKEIVVNTYSGSFKINEASGVVAPFAPEWMNGSNYGMAFYRERDTLWMGFGYHYGLGYPLKGGSPAVYRLDPTFPALYDANAFCRLADGKLLLGCRPYGLLYLDEKSRTLRQYGLKDTAVYHLLTHKGQVWAGTQHGLYNLNKRQFYFGKARGFEALNIYHIHVDGEGNFWLATQRGLFKWHPGTGAFRTYGASEGLPQDRFHAIYSDRSGRLWLSSNNGLFCFNPGTGQSRAFYEEDGLPDNESNFLAHAQAPNGHLYFGTVKGLFSFDPNQTELAPSRKTILYVTGIERYTANKEEAFDGFADFLKQKVLRIPAGTNRTVIQLSAPYFGQQSMAYEWRIPGKVDQWQISYEPEISLFLAPYGNYQVEVRAYLRGNKPGADVQNLLVRVASQKPLHLRWWVIGMIILGFGFGYLGINRLRLDGIRRENLILEEKVVSRTKEIGKQRDIIQEQNDALKKLDEAKSRFFAHINHEFRTPLSIINGYVDKLLRRFQQDPEQTDSLIRIQKNAQQMKILTEDMLAFARLDAARLPITKELCHWPVFIQRLAGNFTSLMEEKQIAFHIELEEQLPDWITADVKLLERIINNLISNALKFTPEGGVVTLQAGHDSQMLTIEVSDTGVGIAEDDLPKVFDRYFQVEMHLSPGSPGFGIGLSLCREYAEMLGGKIEVESTLGEGSTFTLYFPLEKSKAPKTNGTDIPQAAAIVDKGWSKTNNPETTLAHLLIVEDNKEMQDYLYGLLNPTYRITQHYDGKAALDFLSNPETPTIDLVISDILMPKLDGFGLLTALRNNSETATLPFIFLTALAETEHIVKGLQIGVDSYVTKPFVPEELEARINNLLKYSKERTLYRNLPEDKLKELTDSISENMDDLTQKPDGYDAVWLSEFNKLVEKQLDEPGLKIDRLAVNMHVSERTLRNKLKAFTGLSPADYLMKARLSKALYFLEHRRYQTAAEVCHAVGLRNPSHFTRVFKEEFGRLPSEYLS